jgi:leucyl/phenylalanyl-tRNA--protein transferase
MPCAWPPIEPPPCEWRLPDPLQAVDDLAGIGADLAPGTLLAGYRSGLFPMDVHLEDGTALGWWSPDPRAVLPLDGLRITSSLRQSARRMRVTHDVAFVDVMRACSRPAAPDRWISPDFIRAYTALHELGWAHSVEVWDQAGDLVGGLYGVQIGGFFAGESMFHVVRDASKVALVDLVRSLGGASGHAEGRLLDVQWRTEHLGRMGALAIPRAEYLGLLRRAITLDPTPW